MHFKDKSVTPIRVGLDQIGIVGLHDALKKTEASCQSGIIEIRIDRERNREEHVKLWERIDGAIGARLL